MAATVNPAVLKKLIENLQTDLRNLSSDCKRKYPPVKEASEACLLKIRNIYTSKSDDLMGALMSSSMDLVQPFLLGCDTKNPKIVHHCLAGMQRLISHGIVSPLAAESIVAALWVSMEAGVEELKLLQTAILLITTTATVQHEALAKAIVLCFRLHFTKDSTTINTAAATVRQLVTIVFERVTNEDQTTKASPDNNSSTDPLKTPKKEAPKSLKPHAQDAYMLFQDLCQLVNADQPLWLVGMTEMTRTFGLELMESLLTTFPKIFIRHQEFSFLLKERVCPLVIKLFSPSLKYRIGAPTSNSAMDKPYFPIVMRLLRIVAVLTKDYYEPLVTECEIFLSLLVKFIDADKPMWQRATALEVLVKLTSQPHLLHSFCASYDMKKHSTKIFQDIVNGLGAFIQAQFIGSSSQHHQLSQSSSSKPDISGTPPSLVGGLPVGSGVTPQPAFYYRNVWTPLVVNITGQHNNRAVFLEMLDRIEPPSIPDGYGLSLAFLSMLNIVKGVNTLVENTATKVRKFSQMSEPDGSLKVEIDSESQVHKELINSSWCGILAALSILLEASTDESATESILKAIQNYASICGSLELHTPRDAFITALCKASLPPHYTLTILNTSSSSSGGQHKPVARQPSDTSAGAGGTGEDGGMVAGSQVVAVGTALPTASLPLGAQQGPVMLTSKNIQCMRAILGMAHCHGAILGTAWHQILTTLQHLVWILGLKPSAGGSLKAPAQDNPNAVITTAVMADLPVLSAMLSRLFESSQYLDDVALHHLIDALCKLSTEAMEVGFSNKEPSLFAVAKLLETGLVNMSRVTVLWKPVTAHLLEVCQHTQASLRAWGAEAVTSLIKAALIHNYGTPLYENMQLQLMLLAPLQELSSIRYGDIRQKQLECTLQVLHNNGETLGEGWPLMLNVIGSVNNDQGEALIRTAFQCLQLVVTDFLPIMPCTCLQICVHVAAKFGLQNQELNISLTSVGLMWNISDFFYQNRERIRKEMTEEGSMDFDTLWLCLFQRMGELCVDPRPAVRKSAGQTLFSTIATHSTLLQPQTWNTVLWKVLFPLLDQVKKMSTTASGTKDATPGGNILIHHSRDTAQKQWAETQVLSLAGVARVFNTKRKILQHLGDFPRAWALLLEYIENSALCQNPEVSLAALKSFQEILQLNKDGSNKDDELKMYFTPPNQNLQAPQEEQIARHEAPAQTFKKSQSKASKDPKLSEEPILLIDKDSGIDDKVLWANAWRVWLSIGTAVTSPPETSDKSQIYIPSQPFLTALIQTFPALYAQMKSRFFAADLQKLFNVLQRALIVPVHSDSTPFIMPVGEVSLTPLQEAILYSVKVLHKEVLTGSENIQSMCPDLFEQMLKFVEYAVKPPKFGKVDTKSVSVVKANQAADWVAMNYVPFAEAIVEMVVELYSATAGQPLVIKQHVLYVIIKSFHIPLGLKYGCPAQSTWMLVVNALLRVLAKGLPIAAEHPAEFKSMWTELGNTLDAFLFSQNPAPPTLSVEDFQRDEAIDCKVVYLLRDKILPRASTIPNDFIVKVMGILNKGSIHSAASSAFIDVDSSRKLREEFAKACFETLLQFSFVNRQVDESSSITKLAVSSLLKRCKDVLEKYVEDERLSGKCPLPRPRMSEMAFVLKAISTLLVALKKAPASNVERNIWEQVICLYPALVECTTSTSSQVCRALKEALVEYKDLLSVPRGGATANGV